jgi:hypothetical protein
MEEGFIEDLCLQLAFAWKKTLQLVEKTCAKTHASNNIV